MGLLVKCISLTTLLLVSSQVSSQIDFKNTSYGIRDSNVLFKGMVHHLVLVNTNDKSIKVAGRGCHFGPINDTSSTYEVLCDSLGSVTFHIVKNNRVLRTKVFQIKEFKLGVLHLGTIKEKSAFKNEIIANRGIVYDNLDCNCSAAYRVVSYKINIKSDRILDGDKEIGIEGPLLSSRAISIINRLGSGDSIEFTQIIFIFEGGCPREYPSFTLTIK